MPAFVDTHCHLDAPEFAPDAMDVRRRAAAAGVRHCVIPAVAASNFRVVRELAAATGDSYALGIHPMCTPAARDADLELLDQELTARRGDPRLVAVGEIGLDFFVPGLDPERQEFFYRRQLELARKHALPVILHVRRSADRLLKQLRTIPVTGIAHAFNGSSQQAEEFVRLGFKLGFGGAVTFDRALQLRRLAATLPLDALVLETDSPDIPPSWIHPGRNTPDQLPAIGAALAQLRGIGVDEVRAAVHRNTLAAIPRLAGFPQS